MNIYIIVKSFADGDRKPTPKLSFAILVHNTNEKRSKYKCLLTKMLIFALVVYGFCLFYFI